jgi:hypothetical protein
MAEFQRSAHVPTKAMHLVETNLTDDQAPICPRCGLGRCHITGQHDWRRRIIVHCDNPDCGGSDPNDEDKGTAHFARIFPDGTFNRFDGVPTEDELKAAG